MWSFYKTTPPPFQWSGVRDHRPLCREVRALYGSGEWRLGRNHRHCLGGSPGFCLGLLSSAPLEILPAVQPTAVGMELGPWWLEQPCPAAPVMQGEKKKLGVGWEGRITEGKVRVGSFLVGSQSPIFTTTILNCLNLRRAL